jgi:hypothetical protein
MAKQTQRGSGGKFRTIKLHKAYEPERNKRKLPDITLERGTQAGTFPTVQVDQGLRRVRMNA